MQLCNFAVRLKILAQEWPPIEKRVVGVCAHVAVIFVKQVRSVLYLGDFRAIAIEASASGIFELSPLICSRPGGALTAPLG